MLFFLLTKDTYTLITYNRKKLNEKCTRKVNQVCLPSFQGFSSMNKGITFIREKIEESYNSLQVTGLKRPSTFLVSNFLM